MLFLCSSYLSYQAKQTFTVYTYLYWLVGRIMIVFRALRKSHLHTMTEIEFPRDLRFSEGLSHQLLLLLLICGVA